MNANMIKIELDCNICGLGLGPIETTAHRIVSLCTDCAANYSISLKREKIQA